jgi:hypothetical protein
LLSDQGKHGDAERIEREVLDVKRRFWGFWERSIPTR